MEDIPLVLTNNNNNASINNSSIHTNNNTFDLPVAVETRSEIRNQEKRSIINSSKKKPILNLKRGEGGVAVGSDMATSSNDTDENNCDENDTNRVKKIKIRSNNRFYKTSSSSKVLHRCFNFNYVKHSKNDYDLLITDDCESPNEENEQLTTQTISFETNELTNFNSSNSKRACCCCCCFYCCCNLFNRFLTICFK